MRSLNTLCSPCKASDVSYYCFVFFITDASDVIAKDLVAAGLIEGKNLVVGEYM